MVLGAFSSAAVTSAAFPLLSSAGPHLWSRSALVRFSLPGSPDHAVHLVPDATERAALTASHSLGEATATRLPFLTISAVGNRFLSTAPTETRVDPRVAGRTIAAYSIPGSATSQLHCVLP